MYVYSTMGQSTEYVKWANTGGTLPVKERSVIIKGGTGVIDPKTLITPFGTRTEIPDADFEWLKEDYTFKQHVANGFIIHEDIKVKAEKVAKNMSPRDNSAQHTVEDMNKRTAIEGPEKAAKLKVK